MRDLWRAGHWPGDQQGAGQAGPDAGVHCQKRSGGSGGRGEDRGCARCVGELCWEGPGGTCATNGKEVGIFKSRAKNAAAGQEAVERIAAVPGVWGEEGRVQGGFCAGCVGRMCGAGPVGICLPKILIRL